LHALAASLAYSVAAANHDASRGGVTDDVTYAKAKLVSICPAHFLAEYFAEVLQVFASFSSINFISLAASLSVDTA